MKQSKNKNKRTCPPRGTSGSRSTRALLARTIDSGRAANPIVLLLCGTVFCSMVGESTMTGLTWLHKVNQFNLSAQPGYTTQRREGGRENTHFVDLSVMRTSLAASWACFFSSLLVSDDLRIGLAHLIQTTYPRSKVTHSKKHVT